MNQQDRSTGSNPVKLSIGCRQQKLMALHHREVRKELGTLPHDDDDDAGDEDGDGFASAKKLREIEEATRALMEENKLLRRTAEAAIKKKADDADAVLKSLFQSSTGGGGLAGEGGGGFQGGSRGAHCESRGGPPDAHHDGHDAVWASKSVCRTWSRRLTELGKKRQGPGALGRSDGRGSGMHSFHKGGLQGVVELVQIHIAAAGSIQ